MSIFNSRFMVRPRTGRPVFSSSSVRAVGDPPVEKSIGNDPTVMAIDYIRYVEDFCVRSRTRSDSNLRCPDAVITDAHAVSSPLHMYTHLLPTSNTIQCTRKSGHPALYKCIQKSPSYIEHNTQNYVHMHKKKRPFLPLCGSASRHVQMGARLHSSPKQHKIAASDGRGETGFHLPASSPLHMYTNLPPTSNTIHKTMYTGIFHITVQDRLKNVEQIQSTSD